ncbi:ABC transporter permease [Microbacterium sp. CJ88]|uniref:ABC transporter permease n=1 Tax=Microbacterium sp. CJ88 TaxID=3445672 RepID=UPI003F65553B
MSGFGALLAQRLRRDRVQVPMWAVGTALLALLTYVGVHQSFGTAADRMALLATAAANPVVLLFRGLPSGPDEGAFVAFLIFPFLAMLAAFMSSFLAVRHTRGEEEPGRAELVAGTPAGRTTPLLATIAHGVLANAVLAVLTALALVACGFPGPGSWIAGVGAAAVGLVFLGVGLVAAQAFSTSRGANALGVWVLLVTYLLCGIGNALGTPSADLQRIESSWLTWVSPFGWGENTRPFADDAVWPIVLCAAVAAVLAGVAVVLQATRDVGAGFVDERPGRVHARPVLATPLALVWRLTWPGIVGWIVGGVLTGVIATKLASVLGQAASALPSVQAILDALTKDGSLAQGAIVIFFTMLGILAAACGVQVVCRARQEEAHGTAEPVLSSAVDRVRWLAGYVAVGFAGIVLVIAGAVVGATAGLATLPAPDWTLLGDVLVTGGGQVAAASVFLVVTALVFVVAPRLTIPLGWTLVALGMILGLFGALFGFPDWLVHLAPIADAPTVTGAGVDLNGLWWLVLAVVVGAAASLALMRRRELAPAG